MSFPETRLSLIRRLVRRSTEQDWGQFLTDYWGPICRFAAHRGSLSANDAEELASQTFEILIQNQLLAQWAANRTAKLRSLLCAVVRNLLANRQRLAAGRRRLLNQYAAAAAADGPLPVWTDIEPGEEDADAFYAAWVDDLLQQAIDALMCAYHQEGKGNYFRVLYGRICEELSVIEISVALEIKPTDVENYYRAARKRLARELHVKLSHQLARYGDDADLADELTAEWARLSEHLRKHGGLEQAIRNGYRQMQAVGRETWQSDSFLATTDKCCRLGADRSGNKPPQTTQ